MKPAVAAVLFLAGAPLFAHRLDEYLQATLIAVEKDRVHAQIRLTPGLAVLPVVLADIDRNADGVLSPAEQRAYAERVVRELSLKLDGYRVPLRLTSAVFPEMADMKEGLGAIQLEVSADVPRKSRNRKLVFENHHQSAIAAYLANCLVPRDPDIRVIAQNRNYQQSFYELDYTQTGGRFPTRSSAEVTLLCVVALLIFVRIVCVWRSQSVTPGRLHTDRRPVWRSLRSARKMSD